MICKLTFFICIIVFFLIYELYLHKNKETFFDNKNQMFENMMNNHYKFIFPNNANRNAAGFRFFEYIYDNLSENEAEFDIYNQFYCAVSGSIVSPDRPDNYDILKVSDKNGKCVIGKYYRCCTPCNCDIMKYTQVINTKIEMPKGSGNYINRNLITIGDPCSDASLLPDEIDKNIFKCNNNLLDYGYRVNQNNELTKENGRLVIGVLYPAQDSNKLQRSLDMCTTGNKRILTPPENLKYGMGDIFVKVALINNNKNYTNTLSDLCN